MVKLYDYIDVTKEKLDYKKIPTVIWGISENSLREYLNIYIRGANVIGFTDSFHTIEGEKFAGLPIYTYAQLEKMEKFYLFITADNFQYKREIMVHASKLANATILAKGIVYEAGEYDVKKMQSIISRDKELITKVRKSLYDNESIRVFDLLLNYRCCNDRKLLSEAYETRHPQYFPNMEDGIINTLQNEVFIDAGAYDGDTSIQFSKWCKEYDKIYLLEPDSIMYNIMCERLKIKQVEKYEAYEFGAYSTDGEISFYNDAETGSSAISENDSDNVIKTISIDSLLKGGMATYIKMDIEGAEMEALKGAEGTITKYHPKLAISIYHKEDDLWNIPCYIHNKYPFYKLFIRHYTDITTD